MGYRYFVPKNRPTQVQLESGEIVTAYPLECFGKGYNLNHITEPSYFYGQYWWKSARVERMQLGRIAKDFRTRPPVATDTGVNRIKYVYDAEGYEKRNLSNGGRLDVVPGYYKLYKIPNIVRLEYPRVGVCWADVEDRGTYMGLIREGDGAWTHHASTEYLESQRAKPRYRGEVIG